MEGPGLGTLLVSLLPWGNPRSQRLGGADLLNVAEVQNLYGSKFPPCYPGRNVGLVKKRLGLNDLPYLFMDSHGQERD
jgi:hypothetical protein